MANKIYTHEHIDYLREISPGRYNGEITKRFNEKFGMNATEIAIRTLRQRHGIKLTIPRARKQYTDEQFDYLKELSARGLFNAEITRLFNERFGTRRTEAAIQIQRMKYGMKTVARNYWKPGHTPWNKGKRGWCADGCKKTWFKKGHIPQTWVPVGSERLTKDGYIQIKIQDGKGVHNWKGKHVLIWERHHGRPVPSGHAVIFGDSNNRNFDPDNLILVSRAQLARLNQRGLIRDNAELTRTGIIIADICNKIGERRKKTTRRRSAK